MYPLDDDINDSLGHLKDMETKYGRWDLPKDEDLIQMNSDPACTSNGCETRYMNPDDKVTKPVLYNFDKPLDSDVISTQKHIADQEKVHGKWTPPEEDVQIKHQ